MRGLFALMLVGCAGVSAAPAPAVAPSPAQHQLGTPLLVPGESMIYEVTLRGLRVGRVQVAIGKPGWVETRPAIKVKSRGVADGLALLLGELDWQLETTIDLETGAPLKTVEDAVVIFRGKTETSHRDQENEAGHSLHSAAAALRGWRSVQAQEAAFDVRVDEARIDVKVHEAGREWLASAAKPTVRYEGVARTRFPFKIWISDDTARVPLLIRTETKWGSVIVELVEYNAPRD